MYDKSQGKGVANGSKSIETSTTRVKTEVKETNIRKWSNCTTLEYSNEYMPLTSDC